MLSSSITNLSFHGPRPQVCWPCHPSRRRRRASLPSKSCDSPVLSRHPQGKLSSKELLLRARPHLRGPSTVSERVVGHSGPLSPPSFDDGRRKAGQGRVFGPKQSIHIIRGATRIQSRLLVPFPPLHAAAVSPPSAASGVVLRKPVLVRARPLLSWRLAAWPPTTSMKVMQGNDVDTPGRPFVLHKSTSWLKR